MRISLLVFFLLAACAPSGPHKPVATEAKAIGGGGGPGFAEVSAVFQKNCTACHPSKQPADWLDFGTAKRYAENGILVRRVVAERSMPERGSPQAAAMTDDERKLIAAWVAAGAPRAGGAAPAAGGGDAAAAAAIDVSIAPIQSCTSCHGVPPAGPNDPTTPRLNGQGADYLALQLNLFANFRRLHLNGQMNKIAGDMSPTEIAAAAHVYAASPSFADVSRLPEAARVPEFQLGRSLAGERCILCHLKPDFGGRPNHPLIPVLAGQSERYLRDQLRAYRSGYRENKEMHEIANSLSDEELDAVAYYFSVTTPALSK